MAKGKDPAILFYPKDFIAETQLLSFEEIGKMMTLRASFYQHGRLSLQQVNKLIGELPDTLKPIFKQDADGLYYCPQTEEIMRKRSAFKTKLSEDGKKGQMVAKLMRDKGMSKEEARDYLHETKGYQFGKEKYSSSVKGDLEGSYKGSLSNKGNAIGNEDVNDKQKLKDIEVKILVDEELTIEDINLLEKYDLDYPGKYDDQIKLRQNGIT